jgi:hypothetical protein
MSNVARLAGLEIIIVPCGFSVTVIAIAIIIPLDKSTVRKGSFAPGEFYHVYNRDTEKRIVFLDDNDYQRFLALL